MEAIAGVDIAVWDAKAQALGIPLYHALGAVRSSVRGYASGGWAPGDEAGSELAGYAAKGQRQLKGFWAQLIERWARPHAAAMARCHCAAASARKIRRVDRETRWR